MKTTIEISDSLLQGVREVRAREGAPFKLRKASFKGDGLQADLRAAPWETVRGLVYRDRGA